nr:vegetative cell wall protein gp1-like [Lolium perenne]
MGMQRAERSSGDASDRAQSTPRQSSSATAAPPHHVVSAARPHHRQPTPSVPASLLPSSRPTRRSFAQVVAGDRAGVAMSRPSRPTVPPGATAAAPGAVVPAPGTMRPVALPAPNSAPYLGPPGFQGWPSGTPMPTQTAPAPQPHAGFRPPARAPAPPVHYIPPQQPYQQYPGQYFQYPQAGQQYMPQVPVQQVAPQQPPTQQQPTQLPPIQQPPAQPGQGKKRRKKKAVAVVGSDAGVGAVAPPLGQSIPDAMGQPSVTATQDMTAAPQQVLTDVPVPVAPAKQKKVGRCWKCAVNTHATKDCKVPHYCLVSGEGTVTAAYIQSLLARMCPGNPTWRWEASPHGDKAFLVGIPTLDDLARIDGMQMSVPKVDAQAGFLAFVVSHTTGATQATPTPLLSSASREVEVEPASLTVLAQPLAAPLFRQGMLPVGLSSPPPLPGPGQGDPSSSSPLGGQQPRGGFVEEEAVVDSALLRRRGEARGDEAIAVAEPRAPTAAASPRAPEAAPVHGRASPTP